MVTPSVQKVITEYKKTVKANLSRPRFFVFGSASTGRMTKDSDIDLMVVSPSFAELNDIQRMELLSRFRHGVARKTPMDIIGLSPTEFTNMKKQKNIYCQDILRTLEKV